MAQTATVKNGVSTLSLEEVVIGSQLRIAVYFERLVSQSPDVYEPIDFTDKVLQADVKIRPSKEIVADTEFTCDIRVDPGWVDLTLDGTATGLLLEKTYEGSLKVWPTDHPEQGDTILIIIMPMKYKATR